MNPALSAASGIDRSSETPYYLQLSRLIEAGIDAGSYREGDRLPSESELCNGFNLARSTVREMLRHLAERGRIKLVPRRGAFVVAKGEPGWQLQVTQGFFEMEVDQQHSVETRVLDARRCALPETAASALEVPAGSDGFRLERVRRLDGKVALYSINHLLPELEAAVRASDVISGGGSLSRLLRSAGHETFRARRSVEAVAAPGPVAALLEVPVGHSLLLVTSVSWNRANRPFDFYTSWLRSDVVRVVVEAQAAAAAL